MADDKKNANPIDNKPTTEALEIARLQAELAATKTALSSKSESLEAKQRELDALRNGNGGSTWRTTTTKPTWPFRVSPFRKDLPQLTPLEGEFVDESEAIRCFWRANNGKKGVNKQGAQIDLDSTTVNVECVCLAAEKREAHINQQYLKKLPAQFVPVLN